MNSTDFVQKEITHYTFMPRSFFSRLDHSEASMLSIFFVGILASRMNHIKWSIEIKFRKKAPILVNRRRKPILDLNSVERRRIFLFTGPWSALPLQAKGDNAFVRRTNTSTNTKRKPKRTTTTTNTKRKPKTKKKRDQNVDRIRPSIYSIYIQYHYDSANEHWKLMKTSECGRISLKKIMKCDVLLSYFHLFVSSIHHNLSNTSLKIDFFNVVCFYVCLFSSGGTIWKFLFSRYI